MKEFSSCIKNLPKHFKTAFVNIYRNGVMSFSSIFAVAITLLLIGVISVMALDVREVSANIEKGVTIYVKLDRTISEDEEKAVGVEINKINGVKKSTYSSKDDELNKLIEKQGDDGKDLFESYRQDNPLGAAYNVEVKDSSTITKVSKKIEKIKNVNTVSYGGDATQNMVSTLNIVQKAGTVLVVALVIVAIFMISNTIKITINARRTEIEIMRMVGASNWYIRLPFMIEGMIIGLIGAIVPIIVIIYGYGAVYDYFTATSVSSMLALIKPFPFIMYCSFGLAAIGALVGIFGSAMSMRKFLKL
ncbi:MAG: permease-like cell division protein FtsX [Thomasclavelia sp.]|jgi:cell division transport system permease protein|nr:permease-like cell division protein FtsX [Thomasclavelia sp.]